MHLDTLAAPTDAGYSPADIDPMAWSRGSEQPGQDPDTIHLTVYPDMRHQTLAGLGGSFSELGADALAALPAAERSRALGALFADDGAAFSLCRMPIGASDFARDAYSLAEQADDWELDRFTAGRDEGGLMAFIRGAQAHRVDLRLHASPWSPPGWMKDSGRMVQGGRLRPECYPVYASYFVRTVQAYAAAGIPIVRVLPQNEPDVPTPYPSCVMLPDQMVPFVVEHLAPAIAAGCPGTAVWGGTFRMVGGLQGHECLRSAAFRTAVGGVGYQYSFCDTLAGLRVLHPGIRLMHTESVCHDGGNTWAQAAMLFEDIGNYLRAGCDTYTYWNMVLDQGGRSTWGWRQNSLVTVDTAAGTWRENPDLAVMRLFARQCVPGAVRIEAFSFQRPALAVQRPDGAIAVFVANHEAKPKPVKVHLGARTWREVLPPRSFAVISLDP
jgi:glucosylceramidase